MEQKTIWDQLTGIVSTGAVTATQRAVDRAVGPAQASAQDTAHGSAPAARSVPAWGWVLAGVVAAAAVIWLAKK